jgi:glycosyltransferase involved in cell wall biosynthesis
VALLGHSDDIPKLLAESSCLAHTADIEGCPNAVIEAMASTRAVVSTAVGDVPDLVENDVSGFVVPREDEVLFAERLGQLLSDRALCQRMGENARQRAEKEFSLDRLVAQTLSIYRAVGWREGTA